MKVLMFNISEIVRTNPITNEKIYCVIGSIAKAKGLKLKEEENDSECKYTDKIITKLTKILPVSFKNLKYLVELNDDKKWYLLSKVLKRLGLFDLASGNATKIKEVK